MLVLAWVSKFLTKKIEEKDNCFILKVSKYIFPKTSLEFFSTTAQHTNKKLVQECVHWNSRLFNAKICNYLWFLFPLKLMFPKNYAFNFFLQGFFWKLLLSWTKIDEVVFIFFSSIGILIGRYCEEKQHLKISHVFQTPFLQFYPQYFVHKALSEQISPCKRLFNNETLRFVYRSGHGKWMELTFQRMK